MNEVRSIKVGDDLFEYILTRRKMKNIRLRIKGDGALAASCPPRTPISEVERVIIKNADWIKSAKSRAAARMPVDISRDYYTGEKFLYGGEEHTLLVGTGKTQSVRASDGYIFMTVKDLDDRAVKKRLLDRWYADSAKKIFSERFYALAEKHRDLFPDNYMIKIRNMTSRWGSCMIGEKTVTLNFKLIYADISLLDYVILHELCHFRYRYHDKGFYSLLSTICPDWKERMKRLNNNYIYYSH